MQAVLDLILTKGFQIQVDIHICSVKQVSSALQYKYKYPKRLWIKWQLNKQLKDCMKKTVEQIDPDILIGVSRFNAIYISTLKCRAKKVIECHEVRYNTLNETGVTRSFLTRLFINIYGYLYFRTIERNADIVVTLTEKDRYLWRRAKRTEVIPNFSVMTISQQSDCTQKRVIAVGRLEWEKGFGRLVQAWSIVSTKHPDWHLDIFGKGVMYDTLQSLIKLYKASNVSLHSVTPNISQEYANSSICAVTSYFVRYISTETCNRGKKYRYPVRYKKNGNDDYKGYKEIATQKDFDLF